MKHTEIKKWVLAMISVATIVSGSEVSFAAPVKDTTEKAPAIITAEEENWKSLRETDGYQASVMGGVGRVGTKGGFALLASGAVNIRRDGWLEDISDSVFVEIQAGPFSYSGNGQLMFSTHLKWDFRYNPNWTFYALGGLGGVYTDSQFEDGITLYPRLALGAAYHLSMDLSLRGEVSHEFVGVGVGFHF